jgi:hypothetical protein
MLLTVARSNGDSGSLLALFGLLQCKAACAEVSNFRTVPRTVAALRRTDTTV